MKSFDELTKLPALVDPHVHFRIPGHAYKEDWKTGALAALRGGVTRVLDMPNNTPPCTTLEQVHAKKAIIEAHLKSVDIPLWYGLYFGADKTSFEEIPKASQACVALKIFMGCSTGGLVVDTDEALDEAFAKAKEANMLVAVHAEDEALLAQLRPKFANSTDPADHSRMRPPEAALRATEKAIGLAEKHQTPLYILHMSTKEEVELVRQAKKSGLPVYAEATTHHLFFNTDAYAEWGTWVQMNPPLRSRSDQEALWEGVWDGTIDTIGTDHAPHTREEKKLPFGKAPSGVPGIETLLPLLLDAVHRGDLTLEKLTALTRTNIEKIFGLPENDDVVYVDLDLEREVTNEMLTTKCGWTPYRGRRLKGWPIYTVLKGRVYPIQQRVGERSKPEHCLSENGGEALATSR